MSSILGQYANPLHHLGSFLQFQRDECGVVVYTDLWGKEPHRQVGVGIVMILRGLAGGMTRTLTQNSRDMGSIPAVGEKCPIFITTHDKYIDVQYNHIQV